MAIPKIEELYNTIIDYLADNGESSLNSIRSYLAASFYVPEEEAFFREESARYSLFEQRANVAVFKLCNKGYIKRTRIGFYDVDRKAREVSECNFDIDNAFIRDYEESDREFVLRQKEFHEMEPEMLLVKEVSVSHIINAKQQDTRIKNMLATGSYILDDGSLVLVPQAVMSGAETYDMAKASMSREELHQSDINIYCDSSDDSNVKSAPPQPKAFEEGFQRGERPKKAWKNPLPWVSANGASMYPTISKMLDFIRANSNDFNKCFKYLVDVVYKINKSELSKKSGVTVDKIKGLKNTPVVSIKVDELIAIFMVLKVPSRVVECMLDIAGFSPTSPKYEPYVVMCEVMTHAKYEEVNAQCEQLKIKRVFPVHLKGEIK